MRITIRADSVDIEGYVNAVERPSKVLHDRSGDFIETVKSGAFNKSLKRAEDVRILLDHDTSKDLGGIRDGNLELAEDTIGLKAKATITHPEAVEKAKAGKLRGWSFGFNDIDVVEKIIEGVRHREIKDLNLLEVSLIDDRMTPAYAGTLVNVRAEDDKPVNYSNQYIDEDIELIRAEEDEPPEINNDESDTDSDLYKVQLLKKRFELEEVI